MSTTSMSDSMRAVSAWVDLSVDQLMALTPLQTLRAVEHLDQQFPAGTTYLVVDHLGPPGGAFLIEVEAP